MYVHTLALCVSAHTVHLGYCVDIDGHYNVLHLFGISLINVRTYMVEKCNGGSCTSSNHVGTNV